MSIDQRFQAWALRLTEDVTHPAGMRLFALGIYGWLLVNTLMLLPMASQFWGPEAYMLEVPNMGSRLFPLLNWLSTEPVNPYYPWFIAGQLVFLVLGMLGIWPRVAAIAIYFFSMNLFYKGIELSNGGYHLVQIYLIFLIPMVGYKAGRAATRFGQFNNLVRNLSYYAARLQLAVLYATTGLYKLQGELWTSGEALDYVFRIRQFSHPWIMDHLLDIPFLMLLMTYAVLGYQLLFPLLIWFRKLRFPVLISGLLFHLGIIFLIGFPDFGSVMIASYLVFYPEAYSRKLLQRLSARMPGFFRQRFYPVAAAGEMPG